MTILYRFRALMRWLFRRDEIEQALDTDLIDYIERSAAEKVRAGMTEADARRAARIELGGVEQTKDSVRAALSFAVVDKTLADLRFALRTLRRQKTFTAVAVLTLAFGIGVNVAIFSLVEQILLRPLPVADPERLVNLMDPGPDLLASRTMDMTGGGDAIFSYPMFRDLEREQQPFTGIAAHRFFDASLSTGQAARHDKAVLVSGSYFSVLGLQPALGRLLGPQDDRVDGQAESVVLSHAYWQSEFAGDTRVIGRTLIVNGRPLTIVGVAPPEFRGATVGALASVFVPITFDWIDDPTASFPSHDDRRSYWLFLFARLKPGVTREEAEAAIDPLYRTILNEVDAPLLAEADAQELERFRAKTLALEPGAHGQSQLLAPGRGVRRQLAMLFAASGIVLLLCGANVAGLTLVRGSARTGEMAVRVSMGASRGRLASLLLTESLVLALPAALLSLPVAALTLSAIASGRTGIPATAFQVDVNLGAALFAIGVALLSAVAFGLVTARGLLRTDPARTLQAYGVRQTQGKGVARFRFALATAQIALSMALVTMTATFAQSLANIARIELGFDVDSVVTFSISPETSGYSVDATAQLFDRLDEELAALPGVTAAGSSEASLLSGFVRGSGAAADGAEGRVQAPIYLHYTGPGFFRALDITLLTGRDFSNADAIGAPDVAIVNERFAERFGLGRNVLGQRISVRGTEVVIVGLAADAKYDAVTRDTEPQAYRPRRQAPDVGSASYYIRSARPPNDIMDAVRDTVTRIDPIVPVTNVRTMRQQVSESIATERFVAAAATAFAVLATALAGLGLYGVLAYSVAHRSREIGLRFALGAPVHRVRGMVLRQTAVMALMGIALGVGGAWLLGRVARGVLFGVEPGDPLMLAAAAVVLATVTLCAAYLPARRASRVDPMSVLRYE